MFFGRIYSITFFQNNYEDVLEHLCAGLMALYNSDEPAIVDHSIEALTVLVRKLDGENLQELIVPLKRISNQFYVKSVYSKSGGNNTVLTIPGLTNPKVIKNPEKTPKTKMFRDGNRY